MRQFIEDAEKEKGSLVAELEVKQRDKSPLVDFFFLLFLLLFWWFG